MVFIYKESQFEKLIHKVLNRVGLGLEKSFGKDIDEKYGSIYLRNPTPHLVIRDDDSDYYFFRKCNTFANPECMFGTYSREINLEDGTFLVGGTDEESRICDPVLIKIINDPNSYSESFSIDNYHINFCLDIGSSKLKMNSSYGILPKKLSKELSKEISFSDHKQHIENLMEKVINTAIGYVVKNPSKTDGDLYIC